ncbi:hypothetical protein EH220_03025 [bacterium]|nr:MAG: hypothetical protein EH220_03025 [bacterium]
MNSEFDVFAKEFGAPVLMEHFGSKGLLRIVPDGQIEGSVVDAIIGNARVERLTDLDTGEQLVETRTIRVPLSISKQFSMKADVYVGFDPDPWSVASVSDSAGPIVAFELQRHYIADRSRSNREEM